MREPICLANCLVEGGHGRPVARAPYRVSSLLVPPDETLCRRWPFCAVITWTRQTLNIQICRRHQSLHSYPPTVTFWGSWAGRGSGASCPKRFGTIPIYHARTRTPNVSKFIDNGRAFSGMQPAPPPLCPCRRRHAMSAVN